MCVYRIYPQTLYFGTNGKTAFAFKRSRGKIPRGANNPLAAEYGSNARITLQRLRLRLRLWIDKKETVGQQLLSGPEMQTQTQSLE